METRLPDLRFADSKPGSTKDTVFLVIVVLSLMDLDYYVTPSGIIHNKNSSKVDSTWKRSGDKKENGGTPYGLPPACVAFEPVAQENLPQPITSVSYRTVNLQAMFLVFLQ
ncbi:hypothetical protein AVEN_57952-1 [Araneus ventricosus]|uniref:Uncharacterized protein n=1 Tax=Araneus ventricosus TaxID=182803 RepID=A0A4Y2JGE9_ARAVE|nr:hypothetical protein AVEN_57952-1 [Araneus ventricosus]